jgi:predicted transcriptional regulator
VSNHATVRRTLLLSLRPRFAEAILSGTKTVELRRRPVNAPPRTPIILYASSPTMAIVGTARLREVHILTPDAAWVQHSRSLALSRREFDAYLDGSVYAYLLVLHRACTLNEPLTLRDLRQEGSFQPPQSFRYVAPSDPAPVRHLIPTPGSAMGEQRENVRPETVRKPTTRCGISSASAPAKTSPGGINRQSAIFKIADS